MKMALTFELGKVDTVAIRRRMLGHLNIIDAELGSAVAEGLGMAGQAETIQPARVPLDIPLSPAVRLYGRYKPTLEGRRVGMLICDGFDSTLAKKLKTAIEKEGAMLTLIAPKAGGAADSAGVIWPADGALAGTPSILFEAVAIMGSAAGDSMLAADPDAVSFAMDAKRHLKAIAMSNIPALAKKADLNEAAGIVQIQNAATIEKFLSFAKLGKVWEREE